MDLLEYIFHMEDVKNAVNRMTTRQDHFVCSTSRKKGKEVCDTHFIRAVVLEEATLQHMRLLFLCIANYEDEFRKALGAK